MAKESFFCAVIIVHRFLLWLLLTMPHRIFFTAGLAQSLPLWVRSGAVGRANRLTEALEGSASAAKPFYDCGPYLGGFCVRRRTLLRWRGDRSGQPALLRPAVAPGRSFLRFYL